MHLLDELNYSFSVIGVSETKISTVDSVNFDTSIPGYKFEYVPTPLSSGGVGMYVKDNLNYTIIDKTSNEAFQAKFSALNKPIFIMGDFNINLLAVETCNYGHKFLLSLQSYSLNVFIMGCVTFSLGCYMVCCSVASLAVGYIYLSCSHLYSFASYDRPYALKIKYPVIRGFFYT